MENGSPRHCARRRVQSAAAEGGSQREAVRAASRNDRFPDRLRGAGSVILPLVVFAYLRIRSSRSPTRTASFASVSTAANSSELVTARITVAG